MLFESVFIYSVMYEKAFMIPQFLDQGIFCALLSLRGDGANVFKRQMMSIPRTGVKVGNFHQMERASTLIFMDYVLVNIVSMLVAYC